MFLQSFAVGTVIIKAAHVQTATWGNWFTVITFLIMLAVTIISGYSATRRIPKTKAQKRKANQNGLPIDANGYSP